MIREMSTVLLKVRVVPRAAKSGVAGMREDAWLVRLHAPPVDGAANDELISILAQALGVPRRAVSIASGERSRQKTVRVSGIDAATAAVRLASAQPRQH